MHLHFCITRKMLSPKHIKGTWASALSEMRQTGPIVGRGERQPTQPRPELLPKPTGLLWSEGAGLSRVSSPLGARGQAASLGPPRPSDLGRPGEGLVFRCSESLELWVYSGAPQECTHQPGKIPGKMVALLNEPACLPKCTQRSPSLYYTHMSCVRTGKITFRDVLGCSGET